MSAADALPAPWTAHAGIVVAALIAIALTTTLWLVPWFARRAQTIGLWFGFWIVFNAIGLAAGYGADTFPIQGFNVPNSHTELGLLLACAIMVGAALSTLRRTLQQTEDVIPLPK